MRYLYLLAVAVLLPVTGALAAGSDGGYLYGTVTTEDGTRYTGQLRWGTEEAFWDDVFNSTKRDNPNVDYLDDDELDDLGRDDRSWWKRAFNTDRSDSSHLFAVRFGDLRAIEVMSGDRVEVTFKDGATMRLEGGSNDIGARITVVDEEVGTIRIKWNRVERIDFTETPSTLRDKLGEPLFGTVETRHGSFTGYVQWDHQECLTADKLDGESRDGDMAIEFGDIRSIEKQRRGSRVTLKSGREIELRGSNDVDDDNRGVVVKSPEFGKVKVGWDDFKRVVFEDVPSVEPAGYADFPAPREIAGSVSTRDGDRLRGRIVYDLDEAWDYELLHGSQDDTQFTIPFRLIARIEPDGRKRAVVELRSGRRLKLEDSQDVTSDHDGLLVFTGSRNPEYVRWKDVREIRLD